MSIKGNTEFENLSTTNCLKLVGFVFRNGITRKIPTRIHATSFEGFLLKLKFWIWSYTFDKCASE